jgi:hypothetical protein
VSVAEQERLKLTANFWNNLAVASAVVGLLAPFLTYHLSTDPRTPIAAILEQVDPYRLVLATVFPLVLCGLFHELAYRAASKS